MTNSSEKNSQHSQLIALGYQHLDKKDFQALAALCGQLASEYANFLATWILLARFGLEAKNFEYAAKAFERALTVDNRDITIKVIQVRLYLLQGNSQQAIQLVAQLRAVDIDSERSLTELAVACYQLKKHAWAKEFYKLAIKLAPTRAELHYSLAAIEQYLGNLEESLICCEKAISFNPDHEEAIFLRSNLAKQTSENNHFEELESFINRQSQNSLARVMGCYAYAKELEDCKLYEQSFKWRSNGAQLYRKRFNYDVNQDIKFMQRIEEVYSSDVFQTNNTSGLGEQAIFIIGLPRTGSTLVERVVTSHSEVENAGELTVFPNLLNTYISQAEQQSAVPSQDLVALTQTFDFLRIGQEYLRLAKAELNKGKYFVDKFPQNALYAGLIRLALPKAKIILVERDPMDVCYAMYKQLFTDIYQFSYDLDELGQYYLAHKKLMQHWKRCLGDSLFTVKYESLVADYPTCSRKLIDFCGLEWQDACDRFESNQQFSATASAAQVRKPLYSSSIGLWKNYRKELMPLERAVGGSFHR